MTLAVPCVDQLFSHFYIWLAPEFVPEAKARENSRDIVLPAYLL